MGLYNFKKQFVPFIESGEKTHTIRAKRKRKPRVGETLYLYTGLRQKGAQRIIPPTRCTKVEHIVIRESRRRDIYPPFTIEINGELLDASECQRLAQRDGFQSFSAMMMFWDGRLPFEGDVIHWKAAR